MQDVRGNINWETVEKNFSQLYGTVEKLKTAPGVSPELRTHIQDCDRYLTQLSNSLHISSSSRAA